MQMRIRPKSVGSLSVTIIAQTADVLAQSTTLAMASGTPNNCVGSPKTAEYRPQLYSRKLSVTPMGIVSEQSKHSVICNKS